MGNDAFHHRYNIWPGGISKFADEIISPGKVKSDGFFGMFKDNAHGKDPNMIAFIRNDESANQSNWFPLQNSWGLMKAGMGRLNRSIEAFVYCVLGAQVNMRGSIVGDGGIAQNVRQELTDLFGKAIVEERLSNPDNTTRRLQDLIQLFQLKQSSVLRGSQAPPRPSLTIK